MPRSGDAGARAGSTGNVDVQLGVAVKPVGALLAVMPESVVPAVHTSAGSGVASVRMPVAFAANAGREVPEADPALVALPAISIRPAFALPCGGVAEIVQRPDAVAIAR